MDVISIEGSLRLIFSLVEAEGLDPEADHQKRMDDISAIIAEHFDFIEQILEDMGQWPNKSGYGCIYMKMRYKRQALGNRRMPVALLWRARYSSKVNLIMSKEADGKRTGRP